MVTLFSRVSPNLAVFNHFSRRFPTSAGGYPIQLGFNPFSKGLPSSPEVTYSAKGKYLKQKVNHYMKEFTQRIFIRKKYTRGPDVVKFS